MKNEIKSNEMNTIEDDICNALLSKNKGRTNTLEQQYKQTQLILSSKCRESEIYYAAGPIPRSSYITIDGIFSPQNIIKNLIGDVKYSSDFIENDNLIKYSLENSINGCNETFAYAGELALIIFVDILKESDISINDAYSTTRNYKKNHNFNNIMETLIKDPNSKVIEIVNNHLKEMGTLDVKFQNILSTKHLISTMYSTMHIDVNTRIKRAIDDILTELEN